ncbi:MAG TPA: zinc-binding alcohol dehydrogenase family protein [Terracidiphilus sp.]|jgi:2-desacetyl-2-hydroxyethyl bacteriochlorophyllide A dehydrogenase
MKAVVLEGPGQAQLASIPEPRIVDEDEILLRISKIGLCGTDLNSYRGRNALVSFPRVPGHEIAATVAELNPKYPEWQPGTAVTLSPYKSCGHCAACRRNRPNACKFNQTLGVQRDGALTEFLSVPAGKLFRANLSLKALCLVEPLTVGFHSTARGRVSSGEVVAVFGCGGVGLGAVAAAAFKGATVIGVDLDDGKLATARKAGATHTINSANEDLHEILDQMTDGRGADVIIEAIGSRQTFRAAVDEVAQTGRVVYLGFAKEDVAYDTRQFVLKELDILGSRNALPEDFVAVIRMLEAGRFPVEDAVTHVIPMEETPRILEAWNHEPTRFGKIMVDVS